MVLRLANIIRSFGSISPYRIIGNFINRLIAPTNV
jgi:hypothetical protein